jgi:hypothetical protein
MDKIEFAKRNGIEFDKWQRDLYKRGAKKRLRQGPPIEKPREADLREAWGNFCYELAERYEGHKYICTLTYAGEESPTLTRCIKGADTFERWCHFLGVHGVGVVERGKLHGRLHHHMVLIGWEPAVIAVTDMWREKYGHVGLGKARSVEATARYCAKYIVKDGTSDWRFF